MHKIIQDNEDFIERMREKLDDKLKVVAVRNKHIIPYNTKNGSYIDMSKDMLRWWTNGFWPGLMWLMYIETKKDIYKQVAEYSEELLDKAMEFEYLDHDVGFMWHISSGVNYRVTGNQLSKNRALCMASFLAARYNINGKFIRAWNGKDRLGWAIIDTMMNLPLLYWATRETGDPRFSYIATSHADSTMKNHIRPDGSVEHIVVYDHTNGDVLETMGGQGSHNGSSWSRGQAWAIYGFALSYKHTSKKEYLDTAKRVAHYFISCICSDGYVPKCDFRSPDDPVVYDTTAGVIAACGLIEIADHVDENEKKIYLNAAFEILKALEQNHCNWSLDEDSVLQNGTEAYNRVETRQIPIIYGEYFFVEAFYKLKKFDTLIW